MISLYDKETKILIQHTISDFHKNAEEMALCKNFKNFTILNIRLMNDDDDDICKPLLNLIS